jgi:ribonucleoside-diphosphate reductase alpha chain
VFDPRGGYWIDGEYVPSLLAAIGDVIEKHLISIGFIANPDDTEEQAVELRKAAGMEAGPGDARMRSCPRCSQPSLMRLEGCDTCTSCGFSKCG